MIRSWKVKLVCVPPDSRDGDGKTDWNAQMPMVSLLSEGCDARTKWAGPGLGGHTEEVLSGLCSVGEKEVDALKQGRTIWISVHCNCALRQGQAVR